MLKTSVAILAGLLFAVTVGIASQGPLFGMFAVAAVGWFGLKLLMRYLVA